MFYKIRRLFYWLKADPKAIVISFWIKLGRMVPDKLFLRVLFRLRMGYWANFDDPHTYSEKLQWLKLYNRKPEYTKMVDKCEAKKYVAEKIGEDYVIPLLAVYDGVEDIDWSQLPNQFVMKCTHDCGGLVVCKDKSNLNIEAAKTKISRSLKNNYYWFGREWPYKDVKPRIIVEKYMEDEQTRELRDYKFFCFNGEVKAMFIATERQKEGEDVKFDFFDDKFNHLPIKQGHENAKIVPQKPINFELMKELAAKLSQDIPHVRVDFYECNGKVYFGEMTFYHFCGTTPFIPAEWDKTFGDWIKLSK